MSRFTHSFRSSLLHHYRSEPLEAFEMHDDHDDSHERDHDETAGMRNGQRIQYEYLLKKQRQRGSLVERMLAEQDESTETIAT